MIRAVLFDLDDTLYAERDFYRSGFAVVAEELQRREIGCADEMRSCMEFLHLHGGRQRVFNEVANRYGFPQDWVPELVALFHQHRPRLQLPRESAAVLARLRATYRLGIVTDGHAAVQRRKIEVLGLAPMVDAVVVADELGREHWKPDPLPFWKCSDALRVAPSEAAFVGDNPQRDVLGARNAGMLSIRIRRAGGYFSDRDQPREEAQCGITSLTALEAVLERIARRKALP